MASNPIIPIINGIADALHEINKDAKIYTTTPDNVKKNDAGYFYIKGPISLTEMRFLKDLHQLRLTFDVMFFPPDMDAADAAAAVGECDDVKDYGAIVANLLETSMPHAARRVALFADACCRGEYATIGDVMLAVERRKSGGIYWWLVAIIAVLLVLLVFLNR